ncbi:MAG: cytidylate kinase-like family protein [Lachnospiraceae bacterium]|nr:cytidylate kinase-like family protein [Lachnospiraceae bacterium]
MGEKFVVTIGREFGSGGNEIGKKLAEKLGIGFYDRNMLNIVAEKSGIKEQFLEREDERASNPFDEPYIPYGIDTGSLSERLFKMQTKLIKEKVEEESCVIVGRCSDYILRNMERACHVFIYADLGDRIARVMERHHVDEDSAYKIIKKQDKIRRSYYQYYTDHKWGTQEGKDLMINKSSTGVDIAVNIIIQYLKGKGYID